MPLSPRLPLLTLALAALALSSCTCESGAIVDPGRADASSDAGDAASDGIGVVEAREMAAAGWMEAATWPTGAGRCAAELGLSVSAIAA